MSANETGMRMLRAALGAVVAFIVAAGGWIAWSAATNPDVRLKQPRWVDGAFDHSFWIPVLVVTVGGAVLVGSILWTAYRRMKAGEDLYEERFGRGVRRRGERRLEDEPETGA